MMQDASCVPRGGHERERVILQGGRQEWYFVPLVSVLSAVSWELGALEVNTESAALLTRFIFGVFSSGFFALRSLELFFKLGMDDVLGQSGLDQRKKKNRHHHQQQQ